MADPKPEPEAKGLRLAPEGERGKIVLGGTTFHYAKKAHGEIEDLTRRHTNRGILDQDAFNAALWAETLVGWEDLYLGSEGEEVLTPFQPDLVPKVVRLLSRGVATTILGESQASNILFHEAAGN